jgi:hypothetical protein
MRQKSESQKPSSERIVKDIRRATLAGDTARAATSNEVKDLRQEARALKEVVAEQALELRLLKKSMIADGDGEE